jgi:hypothetical protein
MLTIGLWRLYINLTIAILDIILRPVFYLKHDVSDTAFCLRLQVEPTQISESSLRNVVFKKKVRTTDNSQNCVSYSTEVARKSPLVTDIE